MFESVSHRGKPLAYDISGRPVAFDRAETRLKATAAAAATGLSNVTVAQSGTDRHGDALDLLRKVWSQCAGSLCQEVKLRSGDILLADNSVLLSPCPPSTAVIAAHDGYSDGDVQVALYNELEVLRSCAVDRRGGRPEVATRSGVAASNKEHAGSVPGRGHMLWLGLQVDSNNLKWWWW